MTLGGRNTKIHATVDGRDNPLHVQLTGGQISDITAAYELLEHVDVSGSIGSRVECFFQKIKNYRRIATRYDKLAVRFPGFVLDSTVHQ